MVAFCVNAGSNNPSYSLETDRVNFSGTTCDFEPHALAHARDDCKDGRWQTLYRADGSSFNNQGDCIQYVNTGR